MKLKAFTLIELIVVITILAILGTITFISFQGYSKEARDSKRITDTRNLLGKINLEEAMGNRLSNYIIVKNLEYITIKSQNSISNIGIVNFDNLRENKSNFQDPLNKHDYPLAYSIGGIGSGSYNFIQIATISESKNFTKIFGNYYKFDLMDSPSLFQSGSIVYKDQELPLIYNPYDSNLSDDGEPSIVINGECGNAILKSHDTKPVTDLCIDGSTPIVSGIGPWTWICDGKNGGISSPTCIANKINPYEACINSGEIYEGEKYYSDNSGVCDTKDIILCSGNKIGFQLSACNVGSTVSGTTSLSYGYYFQWGRNKGFPYSDTSQEATQIPGNVNDKGDSFGFVFSGALATAEYINSWANTDIRDNWGAISGDKLKQKGPCGDGYHIPSEEEWELIKNSGTWGENGAEMFNQLKMPIVGIRNMTTGTIYLPNTGNYWSRTPHLLDYFSYIIQYKEGFFGIGNSSRAIGTQLRCIRD